MSTKPLNRTAQEWLDIFHQINIDCKQEEPEVVHAIDGSATSIEYYADQIWILCDEKIKPAVAYKLSAEMAKLAAEQSKILPHG